MPKARDVIATCEPAKRIGILKPFYASIEVRKVPYAAFLVRAVNKNGAFYSPLDLKQAIKAAGSAAKLVAGLPHVGSVGERLQRTRVLEH